MMQLLQLLLHHSVGFACVLAANNHEKMEIIAMTCYEPLCPKGFRTFGIAKLE